MKAPLRPAGRSHVVTSRFTFRSSVANLGPRISTFRRELYMLVRVKLPLIAAISLLTVFVDQATKSLAAQHLIKCEVHSYLFDTVRIVYAANKIGREQVC